MNNRPVDTNSVLNRLLVLHHRSMLMFFGYAPPWIRRRQESAQDTVRLIIEDQKRTVAQLEQTILANDGEVEYGEFPIEYTALHDLSFDYVLGRLLQSQRVMVDQIKRMVDQLNGVSLPQALAQECLGQAKAHLESLEELARHPVAAED